MLGKACQFLQCGRNYRFLLWSRGTNICLPKKQGWKLIEQNGWFSPPSPILQLSIKQELGFVEGKEANPSKISIARALCGILNITERLVKNASIQSLPVGERNTGLDLEKRREILSFLLPFTAASPPRLILPPIVPISSDGNLLSSATLKHSFVQFLSVAVKMLCFYC